MALFGGSAAAQRRGVNDQGNSDEQIALFHRRSLAFDRPLHLSTAAPADVGSAIALPSRSADNVKLDEGRKPAELLKFLGLEQGMTVIDMFGANRYWAEIMAPAVGPAGKVYVWQPTQFYDDKTQSRVRRIQLEGAERHLIVTTPVRSAAACRQCLPTSC